MQCAISQKIMQQLLQDISSVTRYFHKLIQSHEHLMNKLTTKQEVFQVDIEVSIPILGSSELPMGHAIFNKQDPSMDTSPRVTTRYCLARASVDSLTLQCLVSTKRPHVLKQTCSFQLQVCLSTCYLLVDTKH